VIHPWNEPLWVALPARERLSQVLLLAGPEGIGKSAFARTLAQALLCMALPASAKPCDACQSCRLFESGNHPDFRLLEPGGPNEEEEGANGEEGGTRTKAASRWIKVDAVRALADFLALTSHFAGTKVVLIDPADRLYANAANALLKTLEEPVNTRFVMVSSKPARLPPTVRSRCVRINFPLPPAELACEWLEAQGVEDAQAALAMAGGAPLRAVEMSSPDHRQLRRSLIDAVFANPRFDPVAAVDLLGPEHVTLIVSALQRWCYDLLLQRSSGGLRYYPDCAQILHPLARRTPVFALLRYLRELQDVARHLEHPLNTRLLAERCLFGYRNAITGTET
jgi:DNA polymerase III subunit delta'